MSNTENIYGNLRHYTTHKMRRKMQTYCALIVTLLRTESKVSHRNMTNKIQTCDEKIRSTWMTREKYTNERSDENCKGSSTSISHFS